VVTVLTIPAAGSESSDGTVITNEEKKLKLGYNGNCLIPLISVVNPELFFTIPENQIANGVSDMMSHILERYFTNTLYTDISDGMSESVVRTIMKNALLVNDNPHDYDAWCQLGFGSTLAHNGILGLGREHDWACHNIEHELSAVYDIAHGAGLAVLTPAWMKYVYKSNINMFVQFSVNIMGVQGSFRDSERIIMEGINRLIDFYKRMELPSKLSDLGIDSKYFEFMAKRATGADKGLENPLGNLQKIYWKDVVEIFKMAQ
jgi:alcohol dehydrogenase YqhD (iron-dependent ADH family)